uniref:Uncharacterized protein n=1 Tax=Romanomermis culicivorax TaxID=13658 RepID=A0A915L9R9_ROMCU
MAASVAVIDDAVFKNDRLLPQTSQGLSSQKILIILLLDCNSREIHNQHAMLTFEGARTNFASSLNGFKAAKCPFNVFPFKCFSKALFSTPKPALAASDPNPLSDIKLPVKDRLIFSTSAFNVNV